MNKDQAARYRAKLKQMKAKELIRTLIDAEAASQNNANAQSERMQASKIADLAEKELLGRLDSSQWKLWIWENVLCDHSCGMIAVHARTLTEARQVAMSLPAPTPQASDLVDAPLVFAKRGGRSVYGGG